MAKLTYQELSTLAVEVERGGDLSYASSLWLKASKVAKREVNQIFCKHRAAFCERWNGRLGEEAENA